MASLIFENFNWRNFRPFQRFLWWSWQVWSLKILIEGVKICFRFQRFLRWSLQVWSLKIFIEWVEIYFSEILSFMISLYDTVFEKKLVSTIYFVGMFSYDQDITRYVVKVIRLAYDKLQFWSLKKTDRRKSEDIRRLLHDTLEARERF